MMRATENTICNAKIGATVMATLLWSDFSTKRCEEACLLMLMAEPSAKTCVPMQPCFRVIRDDAIQACRTATMILGERILSRPKRTADPATLN